MLTLTCCDSDVDVDEGSDAAASAVVASVWKQEAGATWRRDGRTQLSSVHDTRRSTDCQLS